MYNKEQVAKVLKKYIEHTFGEGNEFEASKFIEDNENDISEFVELFPICSIKGCENIAEWEGWIGEGLIRRVNVCNDHKYLLRGYKEDGI